ncbi:MAG: DUF4126 domain-containing protein [Candidatus Reddybacter sp.]
MESYEQLISTLALVLGVGWASGINLYAAVAVLGFAGATGNVALPAELETLQDPLVIGIACLMYLVEFFADKTPGVDSVWDAVHTFIRIPAGAMLAAGAVGDVTPALEIGAALLGGSMAMGSHFTKASTRLLINTSPEPFSNWGASISEDLMVFGGLWAMLNYPLAFLGLMLVFILLVIWMLPKLWRVVRAVFRRIGGRLGLVKKQPDDTGGGEDGLMSDPPLVASADKPATPVGVGSPFKDR